MSSADAITAHLNTLSPLARTLVQPFLDALNAIIVGLEAEVAELRLENAQLKASAVTAKEEKEKQEESLALQAERIDALEHQLYGKKSEKVPDGREDAKKHVRGARSEEEKARRQAAVEARRAAALANLPVRTVEIPLSPDERCACCGGASWRPLPTTEDSSVIDWVPGRLERIVYRREKAVCRGCKDSFVTAPTPPQVNSGVQYGPLIHAKVVADKCLMALPLHRQARALERLGIPIAVSVICDMFHRTADLLSPIYKAIKARTPTMDVVQADETGQPTLEPGTGAVRKAWMWTFVDAQAILFVYSYSRGGSVAEDVLKDSKGTLVVDGHTAYGIVTTPDRRQRGGCWSHARRQIFLARKYATDLVDGLLIDIRVLFVVEETAIDKGYWGTDRLLEERQKVSGPALDRIFAKARESVGGFSPGSSIAKALQYTLNQEAELRLFLTVCNLPIHNNTSERVLRIIALLRKNALFVGHKKGGEHLAVLLTLCATCQLHGVNPEAWLADVMVRIWERGVTMDDLMPWNWVKGGVAAPELRVAA